MQSLNKNQMLRIMERYGNDPQQLIAVLLDIQAASGKFCVEQHWAELTSEVLGVPLSKIYDVLTFYSMFKTEPHGEFIIEICRSTPCWFACQNEEGCHGTQEVVRWFEDAAGIKIGETTADGKLSILYTSCVGMCDIGPVAKIGDDVFGSLNEEKAKTLVKHCLTGNRYELRALCQN
ncbi:MAG: NAD(P)H-dependent oxidoreductase subunit E [Treponema sp.]|jgi:NADH-quinone oxidoreductase subunit E|nr:NAD(P)H-dependent oxidoreductase subunit E [Treponema sp.]